MNWIRQPAVAGLFYPADADSLRSVVRRYLAQAEAASDVPSEPAKALIVPHAGYQYSGPIAASAYVQAMQGRGRIERVVILGPCHHVFLRSLAASSASAFRTPLGDLELDRAAGRELADLPQVEVLDIAHEREHSVEVQLPFLQEVLGQPRLVPLVVGDASAQEIEQVLLRLWDGEETLVVISSDLSHYYDYQTARRLDAATAQAIVALRPDDLVAGSACGLPGIAGLLRLAQRRGLTASCVDLRNSGDTSGDRRQVVGYGAFAFFEQSAALEQ